ncbi:hypothetical protein NPIL_648871 [Nephila pilipes]|uniref:Uncharacterized protein n=1 Tax=Nephila pilipes TaxID=299642 RepID=A0A8X6P853_NEPPI|nr:hypothetical protein NPIL_648871 [Nephila pilipes]
MQVSICIGANQWITNVSCIIQGGDFEFHRSREDFPGRFYFWTAPRKKKDNSWFLPSMVEPRGGVIKGCFCDQSDALSFSLCRSQGVKVFIYSLFAVSCSLPFGD